MSKPPGICIFCGRTGLSKEHVWANWMRDHLPEFLKTATATNLRMQIGPDWRSLEQIYETSKVSTGAPRSRKLRVVCRKCNSGWMSELQVAARPYLEALIEGRWQRLSIQAQAAVARWACMFTIVYERTDPRTAAIDVLQRELFFKTGEMPPSWSVWIGLAGPAASDANFAAHRGWVSGQTDPKTAVMTSQITVATAGRLCFVTCSSTEDWRDDPIFNAQMSSLAAAGELVRIWPPARQAFFAIGRRPARAITMQSGRQLIETWSDLARRVATRLRRV